MKFINKFKSPNFNQRKSFNIKFIVIHYTALKNESEAINFLCSEKNNVSCHFLISQGGKIFSLVNEKKRAWHAGLSFWDGDTDINSSSIGIELDFSYEFNNNKFSLKMIKSLKELIRYLKIKYNIKKNNILGHSDVSPYRKIDPGPKFPWKSLAVSDLAFIPNQKYKKYIPLLNVWFKKRGFISKKKITLFMLNYIGYDIKHTSSKKKLLKNLIYNYKIRYLNSNYNGKIDHKTIENIKLHFLNLLLT